MTRPHTKRFQFSLGYLLRLMAILASTVAIVAWIKPYFAVGVDPPLMALPSLALALGVWVFALIYRGRHRSA